MFLKFGYFILWFLKRYPGFCGVLKIIFLLTMQMYVQRDKPVYKKERFDENCGII